MFFIYSQTNYGRNCKKPYHITISMIKSAPTRDFKTQHHTNQPDKLSGSTFSETRHTHLVLISGVISGFVLRST